MRIQKHPYNVPGIVRFTKEISGLEFGTFLTISIGLQIKNDVWLTYGYIFR